MPQPVLMHEPGDQVWTMGNDGTVRIHHVRGDGTLVEKSSNESAPES